MQEKNIIKLKHIDRIYESTKDAVYKGFIKPALDGLQELRNISCEQLQTIDRLITPDTGTNPLSVQSLAEFIIKESCERWVHADDDELKLLASEFADRIKLIIEGAQRYSNTSPENEKK